MSELSPEAREQLARGLYGPLAWDLPPDESLDHYSRRIAAALAPTVASIVTAAVEAERARIVSVLRSDTLIEQVASSDHLDDLDDAAVVLGRAVEALAFAAPALNRVRTKSYDQRDNAGPWQHDDGTPCPTYWSDRATSTNGQPWWCTEHQQHVHAPAAPALDAVKAEAEVKALREAADAIQSLHPGEVKNSVIFLRDRADRIARGSRTTDETEA